MKKVSFLAVLTLFFVSCGQSSKNEADKLRDELETQEKLIEADRTTRDRENDLKLNRIKNERYERITSED